MRSEIKDPMLHAASEGVASDDHLRWLVYADRELHRLREMLSLPTPTGYSMGRPNYGHGTSQRAQEIRAEVERVMFGRFSPADRVAVEQVLDGVLAEHDKLVSQGTREPEEDR